MKNSRFNTILIILIIWNCTSCQKSIGISNAHLEVRLISNKTDKPFQIDNVEIYEIDKTLPLHKVQLLFKRNAGIDGIINFPIDSTSDYMIKVDSIDYMDVYFLNGSEVDLNQTLNVYFD